MQSVDERGSGRARSGLLCLHLSFCFVLSLHAQGPSCSFAESKPALRENPCPEILLWYMMNVSSGSMWQRCYVRESDWEKFLKVYPDFADMFKPKS